MKKMETMKLTNGIELLSNMHLVHKEPITKKQILIFNSDFIQTSGAVCILKMKNTTGVSNISCDYEILNYLFSTVGKEENIELNLTNDDFVEIKANDILLRIPNNYNFYTQTTNINPLPGKWKEINKEILEKIKNIEITKKISAKWDLRSMYTVFGNGIYTFDINSVFKVKGNIFSDTLILKNEVIDEIVNNNFVFYQIISSENEGDYLCLSTEDEQLYLITKIYKDEQIEKIYPLAVNLFENMYKYEGVCTFDTNNIQKIIELRKITHLLEIKENECELIFSPEKLIIKDEKGTFEKKFNIKNNKTFKIKLELKVFEKFKYEQSVILKVQNKDNGGLLLLESENIDAIITYQNI